MLSFDFLIIMTFLISLTFMSKNFNFLYLNDLVCQFGLHVIIIYQSMISPYVVELDF